jgi:UDP-glucose 4-epimerase
MRVLLTGGGGYLGSHQAVDLIKSGHEVVLLDSMERALTQPDDRIAMETGVKPRLITGGCSDTMLVVAAIANHEIEAVIHFAGYKVVPESVRNPSLYLSNNVHAMAGVIDAMLLTEVDRIVFSSTGSIYGSAAPCREDITPMPTTPYSTSKLVCEIMLEQRALVDGWGVTSLRYFNPAGNLPSGLLGDISTTNVVPALAQAAITGKPFNLYGVDPIRDFIFVEDVARYHTMALEQDIRGTINIGAGRPVPITHLVKAMEEVWGRRIEVRRKPPRPGDLPTMYADTTLADELFGPIELTSLEGICSTALVWAQVQLHL